MRWLCIALLGLLWGCGPCDVTVEPCCDSPTEPGCQALLSGEAACTAHNGNWYGTADTGAPLCEFSDGGSGPL